MRLARIILAIAAAATLAAFAILAVNSGVAAKNIDFNVPKLQSSEAKLKSVNIQYDRLKTQLNKQSSTDKKTIQNLNQQKQQLEKERTDLQNQVQAKAEEKRKLAEAAANAANTLTATSRASAAALPKPAPVTVPSSGCGDNSYAHYIYSHESTCSTTVRNSRGCLGIGQACPASKLTSACPSLSYACENQFFTNYANSRYGSWYGAYVFWIAHRWW